MGLELTFALRVHSARVFDWSDLFTTPKVQKAMVISNRKQNRIPIVRQSYLFPPAPEMVNSAIKVCVWIVLFIALLKMGVKKIGMKGG